MVPKLRSNLQILPAMTMEGEEVIIIQDPLGLLPEPLLMPPEMFGLLQLMEQASSLEDLQLTLTRLQGGALITTEELEQLFRELDEQFLLESDHYREAYQKLVKEFQCRPVRFLAHGDVSYPLEEKELAQMLDKALEEAKTPDLSLESVSGLVAPHIDLRVGLSCYGAGYKVLQERKSPKVVFLFGVGHQMDEGVFCPTTKDFETPFGVVKNARSLSEKLLQVDSPLRTSHDFFHKNEHSIEFQLLFLRHIWGEDFEIVPILWGSLFPYLKEHSLPRDIEGLAPILEAVREEIQSVGEEAFVVAGVDLAHVGYKFGDMEPAETILLESEPHDKRLLEAFCRGDVEAFWKLNQEVEDRFHVCGFSTLSVSLELLPSLQGEVVAYDIWREEVTQSAVSFASVAFTFEKS